MGQRVTKRERETKYKQDGEKLLRLSRNLESPKISELKTLKITFPLPESWFSCHNVAHAGQPIIRMLMTPT